MSDEMTFTLHNPLTEEEWDMIADVDLDHTPEITFHTKHGKEVVFVKRKTGEWIEDGYNGYKAVCSECGEPCGTYMMGKPRDNFCKWCGAKMEAET